MNQLSKNYTIRLNKDLSNWLDILETKYNIKKSEFIRIAIVEKMKRDIKQLRLKKESEKNYCPF